MDKNILECFHSIQGEGQYIGTPSIFIRFAKCNLIPPCDFCDTKYSWNELGKFNTNDVIKYIDKYNKYFHIVITGGEPMLYQNDLIKIISYFENINKCFTIETNSSILPNALLANLMSSGLWSISPKLHCWNNPFFIRNIVGWNSYINSQFKFVVNNLVEDMEKIKFLIDTQTIDKIIIVQPNGLKDNYLEACRELTEYIRDNDLTNIRVLPQFHRICWGNQKRGV